jgi:pilus assembly protein CpaF
VTTIAELVGLEGDSYMLNTLYQFEERPPLSGHGEFTGGAQRPYYAGRLIAAADPLIHARVA